MKKLKFNHTQAELIRKGLKKSTWRLFDDKDLKVDDEVLLIDKIDPEDPSTWMAIGTAKIEQITEKRLGGLTEGDYKNHGQFSSRDEILNLYRQYYGPQVSMETPVKIITFIFTPKKQPSDLVDKNTTKITEVKLYADGGSRGNPGPSASGYVVMDMEGRVLARAGIYLGVTTNNQAEYQSLRLGLEEALRFQSREVHVYMDSMLVVNQMKGIFKVKNRDLWPIHAAIKDMVSKFKHVTFTHVPRELNKMADAVVNDALDEALRK